MELVIVGCSGSVSGPDSAASSYLVQAPYEGGTFSLLLDCGPGSFGALYRYLDPAEIGAVGLSHLHPDHCLDLTGFHVAATYSPTAPWPAIPVFAPAGAGVRLDRAYDPGVGDGPGDEAGPSSHFAFTAWQPEQRVGPFVLRATAVDHPVEAYAVRVTEVATGASLVFSGDTGPSSALVELARGADLLLCEAAFADGAPHPPGVHLTAQEAAEHADAAGVEALVLTHIPPWLDPAVVLAAARRATSLPVQLATAGARWTIR